MRATHAEFHAALDSENALESLWRAVRRERDAGTPREQVLAQLEELRSELRRSGRDAAGDIVLEVMDCLVGWCSPQARL
jgi:hypothetical protein